MNRRNFLKVLMNGSAIAVLPISSSQALEVDQDIDLNESNHGCKETPILCFDFQWLGTGRLNITRKDHANEYVKLEINTDKISHKLDFAQGAEWSASLDIRDTVIVINNKKIDFMEHFMERYYKDLQYGQSFTVLIDVNKLS